VLKWVQKPDDFASEPNRPPSRAPRSENKQGLDGALLEKHKDKKHAAYEAMRDPQVQISRVRPDTHRRFAFHSSV
jgi:hypothetical protein